ncbi:MAG: phosphate signaling complex protein PhoU [Acidobacteriota bacterium]|jgi:phosphate transport system protein|nr:phosphate signaling complex protein PhoU [Acidobacteriota bacterium]
MEHLQEELEELRGRLLEMSRLVESAIALSVQAVIRRDAGSARLVMQNEAGVNQLELRIDDIAFRLMALQQPMAADLRFVMAAIKINNDLERMGDIAVNIAENALALMEKPQPAPRIDIPHIAELAQRMIGESIDAFVKRDAAAARKVLLSDDAVDALQERMYADIGKFIQAESDRIHSGMQYLFIVHGLERLADHATNIAEDVLFLVEGVDVRHNSAR